MSAPARELGQRASGPSGSSGPARPVRPVPAGPAAPRSVVARALALLSCFDPEHRRLSLTSLARRSGTPLATTHRLVAELVGWGALQRCPDGRYTVGLRLWELGLLAPVQSDLTEIAWPHLQDLHETTGDIVHLAVRDGDEALYVAKLAGRRAVPVVSRTGGRLPLHATGVGKALLAHLPGPEQARLMEAGLARLTRHTIVEPGRLARELAEIRRRGYATTSEEMTLGSFSVAAAVLRAGSGSGRPGLEPVAAVAVVVHTHRPDLDRMAQHVTRAARGISAALAETTDEQGRSA